MTAHHQSRCRLRIFRTCYGLIFVSLLVVTYVIISLQNFDRYAGNHPWLSQGICRNRTARETANLLDMTYKVHRILTDMGIEHWLFTGSVFGALRFNGPRPWDDDVDFGMDGDGTLSTMDMPEFQEAFRNAGLQIVDGWSNSRSFKILSRNPEFREFKVDVSAFFRYGEWMKRGGWGSWLFFINFNRYHTFPARLTSPPLPRTRFGSVDLPVPREGIEVQRNIYPNNWWKIVKPPCIA